MSPEQVERTLKALADEFLVDLFEGDPAGIDLQLIEDVITWLYDTGRLNIGEYNDQ